MESYSRSRSSEQVVDLIGEAVGRQLTRVEQTSWSECVGSVAWVEPENEVQVATVMKLAQEHALAICPVGAGTQMASGHLGTAPELAVSTVRMNRVLEYSPQDMVVTVEPGVSFATLQTVLSAHSQMLPIDPFVSGDATIGGITAMASSGPRRTLYGPLRDLAIGLRVVYPNGQIVKTGGKVVKNVAGYDMTKLFVGSRGSLAVITELTFKLRPLPLHRETCVLRGKVEQCSHLRSLLMRSNLNPSRAEAVAGFSEPLDAQDWAFAVDCDENESAAGSQSSLLFSWAKELGMSSSILRASSAENFWETYRRQGTEADTVVKFQCPPTELFHIAEAAVQELHTRGYIGRFSLGALIGVGRLFADCVPAHILADVVKSVRTATEALGGSTVIEKSPAELRKLIDPFGHVRAEPLMQGIKRSIDPAGILNPGRGIGGM